MTSAATIESTTEAAELHEAAEATHALARGQSLVNFTVGPGGEIPIPSPGAEPLDLSGIEMTEVRADDDEDEANEPATVPHMLGQRSFGGSTVSFSFVCWL